MNVFFFFSSFKFHDPANQIQSLFGTHALLPPPSSSSRSRPTPPPPPSILLPPQLSPLFPKKITARLDHFDSIPWSVFSDAAAHPHVQQLVDAHLVNSSSYFFRASMSHGSIPIDFLPSYSRRDPTYENCSTVLLSPFGLGVCFPISV